MKDHRMQSLLDSWFRDRDEDPRDASGDITRVMADVPQTRQQGRWWPLPAFDRSVSTYSLRELAPAPIPATNGRSRPRGFTVFSALKFIATAAIVALFGGFLLSGILTTPRGDEVFPAAETASPLPMTTEALLSGMVTEEVEPGAYRVVNDGVRDVASVEAVDVVAGYDGGIWLLREYEFLRLGSDGSHEWPDVPRTDRAFEVAPDGTMWVVPCGGSGWYPMQCGDALRSTDGEEWTIQSCPPGSTDCQGFTVAPDGTAWASWEEDGGWRVGHLGPADWQPLDGYARWDGCFRFWGYRRMFLTDADDVYGLDKCNIYRREDGGWELFSKQPVVQGPVGALVDVGRDGTVWLGHDDGRLSRFADGEWDRWISADVLGHVDALLHDKVFLGDHLDVTQFKVAPDGSLWFSLRRSEAGRSVCDGLARFDGEALDRFLPDQCISVDVAADGSVWALADDSLYVITPVAVTADA